MEKINYLLAELELNDDRRQHTGSFHVSSKLDNRLHFYDHLLEVLPSLSCTFVQAVSYQAVGQKYTLQKYKYFLKVDIMSFKSTLISQKYIFC